MALGYDFVPTPFGDALTVFSSQGLILLDLSEAADPTVPWVLEGASRRLGEVPEAAPGVADDLAHLLDDYFDGVPVDFSPSVPIDWRLVDGFARQSLEAISEIPWAQTRSYGEVAILAGSPGAARAVGSACRIAPISIVIPVHRVVKSDGSVGHYGGHPERKRYLLDLERVAAGAPQAG